MAGEGCSELRQRMVDKLDRWMADIRSTAAITPPIAAIDAIEIDPATAPAKAKPAAETTAKVEIIFNVVFVISLANQMFL